MRRDELYLLDIVESGDRILEWLAARWTSGLRTRDVPGRFQLLSTIGEAARALDMSLKVRHARVPWQRVVSFRNVAVHEYFAVNWATVWRIVSDDLAGLRQDVLAVLRTTSCSGSCLYA